MQTDSNILIVDDRKENLVAMKALLNSPGLNIVTAESGNEALGLMLEYNFAVVLLDVQMPGMDGFEVAELMRRKEKTRYIPIIFVTAINKEERYIFKGYETGAVDYLFKPIDSVVLKSKINTFLELHRHRLELENSKIQIEKQNKRLKNICVRDGLTGIFNHRYFQEMLIHEYSLAKRNRLDISCFMVDLDYFKDVNDTLGHAFGDFVLKNFSNLARTLIRKTDILARYGGEEFVILLPHTSLEGARILAEKFRKRSEDHIYEEKNHSRRVTVSIGIASLLSHKPTSAAELVSFADRALYRAKASGRNRVCIFMEEELLKSGMLSELYSPNLLGLRERLKSIIENMRDSTLNCLENLLKPNPQLQIQNIMIRNTLLKTNFRALEIYDMMGERLGFPNHLIQTFKRAAILHDVFRAFFGDESIIQNTPLSNQQKDEIRDYPYMFEELTRLFDIFADERTILRFHHENYDGSGYPEGLRGSEVPIGARLFGLIDAFVAMTSERNYRPSLTPEAAIHELIEHAGKQFDPDMVQNLLEIIEEKQLIPVSRDQLMEAKKQVSLKEKIA